MIDVEDARGLSAEQSLQARLPFDQPQVPKVLAVQAEQVERKEQALATPEQQVVEDRPPEPIHASNLAIEHSALNAQVLADPLSEIVESSEDVSVPGDEPALPSLDEC